MARRMPALTRQCGPSSDLSSRPTFTEIGGRTHCWPHEQGIVIRLIPFSQGDDSDAAKWLKCRTNRARIARLDTAAIWNQRSSAA